VPGLRPEVMLRLFRRGAHPDDRYRAQEWVGALAARSAEV